MAKITVIHGDAARQQLAADLIMTDPPYDMAGAKLARILHNYQADHLVLITTMRQLLEFVQAAPDWRLAFDAVMDGVAPKKSRNYNAPNYVHQTVVYMTRNGARSVFDRRRRQRSDVFEASNYWPTILYAPRDNMQQHGMAKNQNAITDILAGFAVQTVVDPFAGSGTTALAAAELEMGCTVVEIDQDAARQIVKQLRYVGACTEMIEIAS